MTFFSTLKRLPWFEIALVIILMSINGYAASSDAQNLPNNWFTRDDAYYYFKVAQNFSEGNGSTFDGINPTNGYHPLWMLANVPIFALARFNLILPLRMLIVVLAGLRAATSILLYRLLKNTLARPIAMLGALYWAFDYYVHATAYQQGLETGLAAFFLVLFLYTLQRFEHDRKAAPVSLKQIISLAVTATLVMFSRLDLVFLAGLFGLWIVFRDRPLRYLLPFDILLLTISATGAFIVRTGLPEYYSYADMTVAMLAIGLVVNIPLLYFLSLYEHPRSHTIAHLIRQSVIAFSTSTIFTLALLLGLTSMGVLQGSFPRTAPLIQGALSFVLLTGSRLIIYLFSSKTEFQSRSPLETLKTNWRTWLREGSVYYGILGGSLSLYMLWSKFAFGTFSPVSGQIKRWWGSFSSRVYGGAARNPLAFFGIDAEGDFNAWSPVTTAVGNWSNKIQWLNFLQVKLDARYALLLGLVFLVLTLLLLINRKRTARITNQLILLPLLAGAGLQIIQYNITGYSALKEWYWVSQMIIIVLAGCMLLDVLTQKLRRVPIAYVSLYLVVLFWGASTALEFARVVKRQMPYGKTPAHVPYMEVAAFVEDQTLPFSLIGMTGGGNIGYFIQDRTIVNMDGLINSYPYFQANKAGLGSEYLYDMGLNYIFANPDFLERQPYRGQYTDRLLIIERWGGKAVMDFLPAP